MALQEKILKLIEKVNGLNGQVLSLAKRVKALEEKKVTSDFTPDETFLNFLKGYMFGDTTPWILEEVQEEEVTEELPEEEEPEPEESVDAEVLEKLDEVINDAETT